MAIISFKDLVAWQRAQVLVIDIYKDFRELKDWGFRDQIQRAAISISNNIAEGYARRSDKAFKNFLFIALGSAAEVESMLLIATELGYISQTTQKKRIDQAEEAARLLNGLIRKLTADS